MRLRSGIPDYLGVRDVAGGFTWVEYETGERELYDLTRDPGQLDNVADDPGYADERARLAARLRVLVAQVERTRLDRSSTAGSN